MAEIIRSKFISADESILTVDVTLTTRPSYRSTITDNPVEAGDTVQHNVVKHPPRVSIRGVFSPSPLGLTIRSRLLDSVTFNDDNVRRAAFETLTALWETSEPFTLVTDLTTYNNYAFESLDFPDDEKAGDTLPFIATLKRIKVISNATAEIDVSTVEEESKDGATGDNNIGPQSKGTDDARSRLEQAVDFVVGQVADVLNPELGG